MNNWVSVNDKMPTESDGNVLVCMPDIFPYNQHNGRVMMARHSQFTDTWYYEFGGTKEVRPTHWMPLPEPPL